MPKEITHLLLAKKAFDSLPVTSLFHDPIKKNFNLFLAGSVAPDTPFYYIFGPHCRSIQKTAEKFHTSDSSSLVPVLDFLNRMPEKEPGALAFSAGVCCHILSDTVFHPMIYYFCGVDGIHDGATTRHRAFETALDYYFWPVIGKGAKDSSLSYIFNRLEIPRNRVARLYEKMFQLENQPQKRHFGLATRSHMGLQFFFKTFGVYKFICFLHDHKLGIHSRDKALFYPKKNLVTLNFFKTVLEFYDPVQTTFFSTRIDEMAQDTTTRVLTLLSILEERLEQGNNIREVIHHPALPEIRPCYEEISHRVKLWNGNKDIINLIYKGSDSID